MDRRPAALATASPPAAIGREDSCRDWSPGRGGSKGGASLEAPSSESALAALGFAELYFADLSFRGFADLYFAHRAAFAAAAAARFVDGGLRDGCGDGPGALPGKGVELEVQGVAGGEKASLRRRELDARVARPEGSMGVGGLFGAGPPDEPLELNLPRLQLLEQQDYLESG
eukprot:CAMPEP_0172639000 /NCGR_PEP_ID=MMETSP1068-20121228/216510_1 /TAXON_ID=35684 /ORGANISM="Pseudopedinella elastica, Strain CCMP716" /LENGTH=171 /DNA_ID=CAMNT_0013452017 /DNA_START=176 /DNA_END=693 /DNA_ORIENTATION=+